ncbi:hypothetical protein RSOLAG1IB_05362 [Rhizoctonia solani AG-1 IB]|uniref:Uncharacterized protein n=1 Tax=Thanatephorus cucumeris (strain AG1-IB / isolate 7/3/14) TaxID=1108050 RepID=A0A0B7G491_THACB|nr:hypothetical protein RSOLAG1IB_05362 [Rhizoctonia solani AG-1 IB]
MGGMLAPWPCRLSPCCDSARATSHTVYVGSQGNYNNPFTLPPVNQPTTHRGPVYYSALIVAELFGRSGEDRIMDLNANNGEEFTPGYVLYEDGKPTRVLLINYVDDPSGAHDIVARIQIGGRDTQQPTASPPPSSSQVL